MFLFLNLLLKFHFLDVSYKMQQVGVPWRLKVSSKSEKVFSKLINGLHLYDFKC